MFRARGKICESVCCYRFKPAFFILFFFGICPLPWAHELLFLYFCSVVAIISTYILCNAPIRDASMDMGLLGKQRVMFCNETQNKRILERRQPGKELK